MRIFELGGQHRLSDGDIWAETWSGGGSAAGLEKASWTECEGEHVFVSLLAIWIILSWSACSVSLAHHSIMLSVYFVWIFLGGGFFIYRMSKKMYRHIEFVSGFLILASLSSDPVLLPLLPETFQLYRLPVLPLIQWQLCKVKSSLSKIYFLFRIGLSAVKECIHFFWGGASYIL